MKRISCSFLFFYFLTALSFAQNVGVIATGKDKIMTYHEILPTEKLYLQTDRTIYRPGENIWFKAYLTGANNQVENTQSAQFLVELIDPKGKVTQQCNILRQGEREHGDFRLPNNAIGGIYKIRAYSEWMRNFEEDFYFEKELTVQKIIAPKILLQLEIEKESYGAGDEVIADLEVRALDNEVIANHPFEYQIQLDGKTVAQNAARTNDKGEAVIFYHLPATLSSSSGLLSVIVEYEGKTESIARPIPIQFDNITLDFMPEGGDLVANLTSKVAFKALNEFGKPADIEGVVLDGAGNNITTFSSFHDGMGAFELTPRNDQKYQVKITRPSGIDRLYELPKVYEEGVVASLSAQNEEHIQFDIQADKDQILYAILQMQDSIFYTKKIGIQEGKAQLEIPTIDFPMGIAQITFFDELTRPQSERMVFLNTHRQLQVDIKTDKDRYQPREKVEVSIKITDSAGKGVAGNFSAAVVDDKLYTYADDKQDNILSYFLMSAKLKGEIHEPSFYFDPAEEKATKALDYVLMTHAWRCFDWKDILEKERADWEQKVKFKAHQVIIKGYVNLGGQYRENVKLKINGTDRITYTNKRGYFEFKDIPKLLTDIKITAKYKKHAAQVEVNPTYNFFYDDMKTMVQSTKPSSDSEALNIQKDLFGTEQVEVGGQINAGNLPTRNINALAATARGLASADEGSDISVRGSRSNSTDYYIDGLRVSGSAALIPESEVALDEVVVVGYGVSGDSPSSQLSSVDLTLTGTPASSSGNQDYDFNISIPIYQPTLNIRLQNYWSRNYYHPRYFYVPRASSLRTDQRTDFRKTIFWSPNITTDFNGEASIELITSDEITTFRAIVEGVSKKGEIARGETTFYTELPFSIDAKLPVLLVQGDEIDIPIIVKNNTKEELIGKVVTSLPKEFEVIDDQYTNFHKIAPDEFKKLNLRLRIKASVGRYPIELAFQSGMDSDQIRQVIEVVPSTFPRAAYLSANVLDKTYEFEIDNLVTGSIAAKFRAIPNVIEEMVTGVEGILREPYGCFEQVSSSNYPNILVLQLMNTRQEIDREMRQKAYEVLGKGYKKLANYEVRGGGFSLYGKAPASVGLTAYGLVQFSELRKVYDITDQAMIDRAVNWLLGKRNSEGVFDSSNNGAYNDYGNVSDAYLIYALSTMAVEGIDKALAHETARVKKEEDLYCLALAALSNLNYGKKEIAEKLIEIIEKKVSKIGVEKWNTNTTLTRSYGHSKQVELASWVTLALLEAENKNIALIEKSIQFLYSKKRGAGYFGSTQATALALKTMSVYAHKFNHPPEAGKLEIYVNEVLTEARNYDENTNGIIAFNDLGQYLKQGKNSVQVRFSETSKPLPYTLDATWQASMPELQESDIIVSTKLEQEQVRVGESVRLTATISNLADQFAPTPMAIIGIPSSLSLDVKQLKLLQEKGYFDFFEIQDNYLVLHYESLAANEVKEVPIDLKVEFAGSFKAPVNSAFLYYQSEKKHWEEGDSITVIE